MLNRSNRPGGLIVRRPQQNMMMRPGFSGLPFYGGYDPFRELETMQRQMDDLFARVFGPGLSDYYNQQGQAAGSQQTFGAEPDVDIYENNNEFIIHAALPGISQDDIQIQATENAIILTAESRSPFDGQNGQDTQGAAQQQSAATANSSEQQTATPDVLGQQQNTGQAGFQNAQGNAASGQQGQTQQPHTQHRQSRYSRQSRFQFAYTLPEEIKPDQVRANFRNGRLEIHLPKRQALGGGQPVTVQIQGDSGSQNAALSSGSIGNSAMSGGQSGASGAGSQMQTSGEGMGTPTGATSQASGPELGAQHQSRSGENSESSFRDIASGGSTVATSESASAGAGTTNQGS
jgi:HSP20 family molecular chaperone IbpA